MPAANKYPHYKVVVIGAGFSGLLCTSYLKEAGIEWSIHQCKELIEGGAPCLHFYTMGDAETIRRIVSAVL